MDDHISLQKHNIFGVSIPVSLLSSYLLDRSQVVYFDGTFKVISEVAQGSKLGPLLFGIIL